MSRFARGLRIAGASWDVLRTDRRLLVLPLVSLAGVVIVSAPPLLLITATIQPSAPIRFAVYAVSYFVGNLITTFFDAALVSAAMTRLDGNVPTLAGSVRYARRYLRRLGAWALIGTVLDLTLGWLEQRFSLVGRLIVKLIGAAWGAMTFFVVPVLLFEDLRVVAAIPRSKNLFRQRWGEQVVGDGAIGLVFAPIAMVALFAGVAVILAGHETGGLVVGGLGLLGTVVVSNAISGIYTAAVYRYATTGELPGSYRPADLHMAFRPR